MLHTRNFLIRLKTVVVVALSVVVFMGCHKNNDEEEIIKTYTYNSIGVYGGSVSSTIESDEAKSFWQRELNIPVVTYGVSGAGFTDVTVQPDIPTQIEKSPIHRVVVLWCSTNDRWQPVENDDKYSPKSQNGGMRIAIEKLKAKDSASIILGFCSLPVFQYGDGDNIIPNASLIKGQIKVFEEYDIPYLNQYNYFTIQDTTEMYLPDKTHLSVNGYRHIRERQLGFIKQKITK
jgi:hypothetical protein